MRKLIVTLMAFAALWSCKNAENASEETEAVELVFNYQKLPSKLALNPEASAIVETWEEFKALSGSIDVLYKATNNEDLSLAIDDLIEKEKLLEKGTYPELFDSFQVKSRQQVLKTYLYKVKSKVLENQETTEPTIEMVEAYNAIRKQLNVIVNSQLDKKLILDEE
ncbi:MULTISPECIES: hypothetical protein [Flavobacteriaceae]|uniref:Uncharacterized protein n=1 Tax=Flagellimonas alvinocaridis TaxID=2530200 RepID=A0A4V4HXG2_9FLAO|nr:MULTISPECIES: hypothetical protein [Allomuricauda]MDC6361793.1 hypothetical protein [Muricauda sp. SP22]THV60956.1 hypothetical protein EZV76_01070 [Allomuricauda alvinocaridis]